MYEGVTEVGEAEPAAYGEGDVQGGAADRAGGEELQVRLGEGREGGEPSE